MTSTEQLPGLRVDTPTLEPDPVLLTRLSALSTKASRTPNRGAYPKVLLVAASVVAIALAAWLGGSRIHSPNQQSPVSPFHNGGQDKGPVVSSPKTGQSEGSSGSSTGGNTGVGAPTSPSGASTSSLDPGNDHQTGPLTTGGGHSASTSPTQSTVPSNSTSSVPSTTPSATSSTSPSGSGSPSESVSPSGVPSKHPLGGGSVGSDGGTTGRPFWLGHRWHHHCGHSSPSPSTEADPSP